MKTLITILLFTQILCADYARKIDSISYKSQVGTTIALIKLSDESVWKWIPDTFSENMIRNWAEGDEIFIRANHAPGFIRQNKEKPLYCPTVALSFNSYTIYPSLKKYVPEEDTLTLTDGTTWEILFDFHKRTLVHWTKGDRIIPVKGPHDDYELLNLDIPCETTCLVERSIPVGKIN